MSRCERRRPAEHEAHADAEAADANALLAIEPGDVREYVASEARLQRSGHRFACYASRIRHLGSPPDSTSPRAPSASARAPTADAAVALSASCAAAEAAAKLAQGAGRCARPRASLSTPRTTVHAARRSLESARAAASHRSRDRRPAAPRA